MTDANEKFLVAVHEYASAVMTQGNEWSADVFRYDTPEREKLFAAAREWAMDDYVFSLTLSTVARCNERLAAEATVGRACVDDDERKTLQTSIALKKAISTLRALQEKKP
jgi:hypothetical protein